MRSYPYLLEEDDTFEPPADPDSSKLCFIIFDDINIALSVIPALSLEELGMRALSRIPRDKAIEGIHAFNELKYVIGYLDYDIELKAFLLRDDLLKFLRPFAKDGKVVNESDVKTFFATLTEGRKNA